VPSRLVDKPPRVIERVMPVYPDDALRKRIRGLVVLRVLVSENGEPVEIRVEKGRASLTQAAVDAVRHWRFEPARKGGRPVRTFTTVEITFEAIQFAQTPFPEAAPRTPSLSHTRRHGI
jgi:TonB family protein